MDTPIYHFIYIKNSVAASQAWKALSETERSALLHCSQESIKMQIWRSFARSWASPICNSPFNPLAGSRTHPGKAWLSTPMKQAQNSIDVL